jgi:PAS domain S-box-containing protein
MRSFLKHRRASEPDGTRRYWLTPLLAIVLFVLVMITLFWALRRDETNRQQQALARDVEWAQQVIHLRMQSDHDDVLALAREASVGALDSQRLNSAAQQLMANAPEIVTLARVDGLQRARWVSASEALADVHLAVPGEVLNRAEALQTFQQARDTHQTAYSEPILEADGERYLLMQMPVYLGGHFDGTVLAFYSVTNIFRYVVPHESDKKYTVSLVDDKGAALAGVLPAFGTPLAMNLELPLDPPGFGIYLHASSYQIGSNLADNFLVWAVVALSILIIWSLWSLMRHNRGRMEAEASRDRLFNLSLDILCILDGKGALLRINPACREVLGREPRDLRGCLLLDLVHPDDRAATEAELEKSRAGEPTTSFENRCRRINANGSTEYRWLVWTFNPDLQARPEKRHFYAVAHDVTLRRARQQALLAETGFRRAMEDSLLTGMRVIDLQGRITYVNPAFCRMLGFSAEELIGASPPYPYWPRDHYARNHATLHQILTGEAPSAGIEVNMRRKNGTDFDARMYVSPLLDAAGAQTGWMTSMTDITEPKRIRRELASAQERFTTVFEELDAAVSVYSGVGEQLLFANRYYRGLFGAEAQGHRELSVITGLGNASAKAREVHSLATDQWFEVRERTIQWVDGRLVQLQVATDVTQRKRTEEMVRQQQEKVQLTSRLITMGEMASSLAHELNQPLTAIANYSMGTVARVRANIESGSKTDPQELLQALQKTSAQAERAGQIIRRIREFVKRSEPHRRRVNIRTIIDDAVGFAEIEAAKNRIAIRTVVPDAIGDIEADPIMIEQVLLNLLKNAVEAMAEAKQRDIVVEVKDRTSHLAFSVTDHGSGIVADLESKLFEPFYSTKAEGMGMGLNICRSIIEFHHGRLWARNNSQGGSTFYFSLPKSLKDSTNLVVESAAMEKLT